MICKNLRWKEQTIPNKMILKKIGQSRIRLTYNKAGVYSGSWSGYYVTTDTGETFETADGMKGTIRVIAHVEFNRHAIIYEPVPTERP